ncbi:asparagine--tRNA ligase, cytoplasmic-like, partial [Paramuricea clavata]
TLYSSEKFGCDESGNGSENKPFKTALKAMKFFGKGPLPKIMVDSKEEVMKFEEISEAQLTKLTSIFQQEQRKSEKREEKESEKAEKRAKNREEAKQIVIEEDPSLPNPRKIKIRDATMARGERVMIQAWVHRIRRQGKILMFLVLRDGTGFLQCVLSDEL